VATLTHIGQPVNQDGVQPEFRDMLTLDRVPEGALPPVLRELYEAVSPDGAEHWDVVVDKAWQVIKTEPNLEMEQLAGVAAPTLVVVADQDITTVDHAREMSEALPNARLVVVPDATHGLPMEKPDVLARVILDFLQQESPAAGGYER
jgi:pimeloyl-ACP methyl ester carboxylesterase